MSGVTPNSRLRTLTILLTFTDFTDYVTDSVVWGQWWWYTGNKTIGLPCFAYSKK